MFLFSRRPAMEEVTLVLDAGKASICATECRLFRDNGGFGDFCIGCPPEYREDRRDLDLATGFEE
ncbi:MAG: hypothetical protein A2365_04175 [Candidatus Nealsonbacteria bacterium RIFOXYB1_FULL_40_15]|uniref:Uncharacterized protein n=2 Tax=Candidatus Nealsoniibacteriota TaxID=1817911 RepID=A0A1G2ELN1_9BACT|nr:MAG: hypothetical protein A2427_04340 [Candidatus Nealsonbacteria bacterium RIFOXYC1_FULL_40_7]OGZ27801.1 MAG: hypothetical protein A2365_04175 [Candidatus Nealsonbacteria bacterium RIFOXYB1_FULL_40_15]